MAKIKDIHKVAPQPVKGLWWFEITLDTGITAKYSDAREEPFRNGDEMPYHEVVTKQGKTEPQQVFVLVPEPKKEPSYGVTTRDDIVRTAKAKACIEVMGYSKLPDYSDYKEMLKLVFEQLDKL